jgi:hypothetical protein
MWRRAEVQPEHKDLLPAAIRARGSQLLIDP